MIATAPDAGQTLRKSRHGRRLKHCPDRKLRVERLANAGYQLRRQQRVAAEFEEVVIRADTINAKQFADQPGQVSS